MTLMSIKIFVFLFSGNPASEVWQTTFGIVTRFKGREKMGIEEGTIGEQDPQDDDHVVEDDDEKRRKNH